MKTAHLRLVPAAPPACTQPPRYAISIQRPDGTSVHYTRIGGNTCDHAQEAIERAGLGAVVRVVPQPVLAPAA